MVVKLQHYFPNLYGRHSIMFIRKHTTLNHSNKAQIYFNSVSYLDMNRVINRTKIITFGKINPSIIGQVKSYLTRGAVPGC